MIGLPGLLLVAVATVSLFCGCQTTGSHAGASPLQIDGAANVLVFTTIDCPIANNYAPEIRALAEDYHDQEVSLFLVHVDPELTDSQIRAHAKAFGLNDLPAVRDDDHRLARRLSITRTPEVVVLTPDGQTAYRGAIDDWYAGFGKKRPRPRHHWLRDALDAVLAGEPIEVTRTEAIGCRLPVLPDG